MTLQTYAPIFDALVLLMKPLLEVVIHDLKTNRICYISGLLSKREIGDNSLLDIKELETNLDEIVYPKLNFDGRLIKSISVKLPDNLLVCFNCDISIFNEMQIFADKFMLPKNEKPESLFKNDWQEKLHITIHSYLKQKDWDFKTLSGIQKKQLSKYLFEIGAFSQRKSGDYIAKSLNLSRATIFKYLKEWRQNEKL